MPTEYEIAHSQKYDGLFQATFRSMGCDIEMWVAAHDGIAAVGALEQATAFILAADQLMSRFRPDSELARLNARAGQRTSVSSQLYEVIVAALAAARDSDGLCDPTLLNSLVAAGYDRTFADVQRAQHQSSELAVPYPGRWREVSIEPATSSITIPEGVGLDLGGIGKAWAAQKASETLSLVGPCVVNAGGDIAVSGELHPGEGWPVAIRDPHHPERHLMTFEIKGGGIATSGTDGRRWMRAGFPQHHIIDPRSGFVADTDVLTATVISRDILTSERLALAAVVLGSVEGFAYLTRHRGSAGVIVTRDARVITTP